MRLLLLPFFLSAILFAAEENFVLLDNHSQECVWQFGPHVDEQVTPACTFNFALSLMGFDLGILQDANTPEWDYLEGYPDDFDSWKAPHTPRTWIQHSCVWFSRLLALQIGVDALQNYLVAFHYGNQDASGGVTSWFNSSIKISPREQVAFLNTLVCETLDLPIEVMQKAKSIFFVEELPDGTKLFGKTGGGSVGEQKVGWFVGWIEKGGTSFSFAYNIRDRQIDYSLRVPRVKQLLAHFYEQSSLSDW